MVLHNYSLDVNEGFPKTKMISLFWNLKFQTQN